MTVTTYLPQLHVLYMICQFHTLVSGKLKKKNRTKKRSTWKTIKEIEAVMHIPLQNVSKNGVKKEQKNLHTAVN
jgi:hypothetical protein